MLAFDPGYAKRATGMHENICFAASAEECIQRSDLVVLATAWPEFNRIPRELWTRNSTPRTVIDCWRALPFLHDNPGVRYLGLGLGEGFV